MKSTYSYYRYGEDRKLEEWSIEDFMNDLKPDIAIVRNEENGEIVQCWTDPVGFPSLEMNRLKSFNFRDLIGEEQEERLYSLFVELQNITTPII